MPLGSGLKPGLEVFSIKAIVAGFVIVYRSVLVFPEGVVCYVVVDQGYSLFAHDGRRKTS